MHMNPNSKNEFWEKGPILSHAVRGRKPKPFRISTFCPQVDSGVNKLLIVTAFGFSGL